jgi:hypothetical protein
LLPEFDSAARNGSLFQGIESLDDGHDLARFNKFCGEFQVHWLFPGQRTDTFCCPSQRSTALGQAELGTDPTDVTLTTISEARGDQPLAKNVYPEQRCSRL